jgi:hypothetical protein
MATGSEYFFGGKEANTYLQKRNINVISLHDNLIDLEDMIDFEKLNTILFNFSDYRNEREQHYILYINQRSMRRF